MHEDFHTLRAAPDRALLVWIEPWAEGFVVPAGSALELRAKSATSGRLEINDLEDRTVVYAWPGATLTLFCNGRMEREYNSPVPDVPPGMDTKKFVQLVFGAPPRPTASEKVLSQPRKWWQFWR
jgi:hypothetical protein